MVPDIPPVSLTSTLDVVVQWSDSTDDFRAFWQQQEAASLPSPNHLLAAARTILSDVEHRQDNTENTLAAIYRASGQLPAQGDELLVDALVMRVNLRRFVTTHRVGLPHVTAVFRMSIERYHYETVEAPLYTA